jgi:hypothetical protein
LQLEQATQEAEFYKRMASNARSAATPPPPLPTSTLAASDTNTNEGQASGVNPPAGIQQLNDNTNINDRNE